MATDDKRGEEEEWDGHGEERMAWKLDGQHYLQHLMNIPRVNNRNGL